MKAWMFHLMATVLVLMLCLRFCLFPVDLGEFLSIGTWAFVCEGFAAVLDRMEKKSKEK